MKKVMTLGVLTLGLASCTASPNLPRAYHGGVIQVGGMGSHIVTKSAWMIEGNTNYSDERAANMVIVDFNTPGDVMWTNCANGYNLSKCTSSTNQILPDRSPGCGIGLGDHLKNTVEIECTLGPSS